MRDGVRYVVRFIAQTLLTLQEIIEMQPFRGGSKFELIASNFFRTKSSLTERIRMETLNCADQDDDNRHGSLDQGAVDGGSGVDRSVKQGVETGDPRES